MTANERRAADWLADVAHAGYLGISVAADEGSQIELVLPFRPLLIGNPLLPALHGGTVGSLLELSAQVQIWREMGWRWPQTRAFTIAYLRSAEPRDVVARASILKQGRHVVHVGVAAWQDQPEQPIATATGHFERLHLNR